MSGYLYLRDGTLISESSVLYDVDKDVTVVELDDQDYQDWRSGVKVWDGKSLIDKPPDPPPTDEELLYDKIEAHYQELLAEAEKQDPVVLAAKIDSFTVAETAEVDVK